MSIAAMQTDPLKAAHAGAAIATGASGAAQEWAALAGRRYRTGLKGVMTLMACRTPADLIAAQAALVCEELELLALSGARMAEIIAGAAGGAVRSLDGD